MRSVSTPLCDTFAQLRANRSRPFGGVGWRRRERSPQDSMQRPKSTWLSEPHRASRANIRFSRPHVATCALSRLYSGKKSGTSGSTGHRETETRFRHNPCNSKRDGGSRSDDRVSRLVAKNLYNWIEKGFCISGFAWYYQAPKLHYAFFSIFSLTPLNPNAMFEGQGRCYGLGTHRCHTSAVAKVLIMSQAQHFRSEAIDSSRRGRPIVKHCKACWREDFHEAVKLPLFTFGFLLVVTFGLILFIKPYHCVCCGTKRLGWERLKAA